MLGTSEALVKASLQRARASLGQRRRATERECGPSQASPAERTLVRRFADAFGADDIDGVVRLLTDDAWLAMPPAPREYHGRVAISAFLSASATWRNGRRFHLVPAGANTQPAFGCYLSDKTGETRPAGLIVLTLEGDQIGAITRFLDAGVFDQFRLPPTLGAYQQA